MWAYPYGSGRPGVSSHREGHTFHTVRSRESAARNLTCWDRLPPPFPPLTRVAPLPKSREDSHLLKRFAAATSSQITILPQIPDPNAPSLFAIASRSTR
ncbi:MAG TPA: hypothetical protein ENJ82_01375 [Bacteroidetes bacterium]|nr:hypothetical protein [Bacteroidota bacterium]